ncbi:MAG: gliding motility-associated C-terminal domain-containing protein, partial [Bacteroidales bacterium]
MKIIIYTIFFFCSLQAFSQEKWQNKINSFKINNNVILQKGNDNGWFTATNTKSFTTGEKKSEIVVISYDKCGKINWSYKYGIDTASITTTDAISDNNGNIVLTGYFSSPDDISYNGKSFIMKLSSIGNLVWAKVFDPGGVDYVYSIGQTIDGNYFIFSNHDNIGGSPAYNAIAKISSNGNLIWYKRYSYNPIWGSAINTSDGGILIRSGDLIYKLNANGNVLWANSYSNIRYTTKPIEIGNQYIFASYPTSSDSICYLFSLSTGGGLNWISTSFNSLSLKSFKKLSNGNLLVSGNIYSALSSNLKICLTEFNANGILIQQKIIDASPQNLTTYGSDFVELDNQSIICAAVERSGSNDSLILIKSGQLTDFSCTQINNFTTIPQQQINLTSANISSFDLLNQDFISSITKNMMNINMKMACFIPDNNSINLGNDTTLCQNQSLILNTGLGNAYQYLWSTGATTASITVSQAGTYWVKAFICDTIYDTIIVSYITPLTLNYTISPIITDPYTMVNFTNFTLPYSQLNWQTGDGYTYTSDNFQHQYHIGGIYYPILTITDNYGCIYSSTAKVIVNEVTFYVPNSFTPNNDGNNDEFIPKCTGVEKYEIFIYSRWGEEIF